MVIKATCMQSFLENENPLVKKHLCIYTYTYTLQVCAKAKRILISSQEEVSKQKFQDCWKRIFSASCLPTKLFSSFAFSLQAKCHVAKKPQCTQLGNPHFPNGGNTFRNIYIFQKKHANEKLTPKSTGFTQ